ncbi:hypothetical protein MPLDJ20_100047 [Mesorhizobium plurifarium]|uniref:Uncharacterized protein n=1 Tax=Mesorhizobium plurifarium TaxID=69974 RepID=A0A090F468_MESPL|nr:hypothetical protein MPLDJ20_100047 [Mesorhizobium plurifarium]
MAPARLFFAASSCPRNWHDANIYTMLEAVFVVKSSFDRLLASRLLHKKEAYRIGSLPLSLRTLGLWHRVGD